MPPMILIVVVVVVGFLLNICYSVPKELILVFLVTNTLIKLRRVIIFGTELYISIMISSTVILRYYIGTIITCE